MSNKDFVCAKCRYTFNIKVDPSKQGRKLKCPKCQSRNILWGKQDSATHTRTRRRPCCG